VLGPVKDTLDMDETTLGMVTLKYRVPLEIPLVLTATAWGSGAAELARALKLRAVGDT
jgi:hypothetical protein